MARSQWKCLVAGLVAVIGAVTGVGVSLHNVVDETYCSGILDVDRRSTVTYNTTKVIDEGQFINIIHTYPYGTVRVFKRPDTGVWANTGSPEDVIVVGRHSVLGSPDKLMTEEEFVNHVVGYQSGNTTGGFFDDDPVPAYSVNVTADPSALQSIPLSSSDHACSTLDLTLYIPINYPNGAVLHYDIDTHRAFTNVSFAVDVTAAVSPQVSRLYARSHAGSTLLDAVIAGYTPDQLGPGGLPIPGVAPGRDTYAVDVESKNGGDVVLKTLTAPGIRAVSHGGNVVTSVAVSSFVAALAGTVYVWGDEVLEATGEGYVIMTGTVGGENLYVTTEHGAVVADSVAGIVAQTTDISSEDGSIYFNTWLQAAGNLTTARTGGAGELHLSALFANRFVGSTSQGQIAVAEAFLGIDTPHGKVYDLVDFDQTALVASGQNYTTPGLQLSSSKGAISVLGVGGSPLAGGSQIASAWANELQLSFTSQEGDVKVQVNGGGYNGPYSASSVHGQVYVEINEEEAGSSGDLGTVGDDVVSNSVFRSVDGDVDVVLLPSALTGLVVN